MNPQPAKSDAYRRIEALYQAAVIRSTDERAEFLAHACAGDHDLLREVRSLLDAHDRAEDFLEMPALESAARRYGREPLSWIGRQIGRYRIVEPIGAGGMGEVYRAEDPRLGRDVAIKILPATLADDPEALMRFRREARAVATLSHPNILSLHDFDTDAGVHFAVMELLEGVTISARIAQGPIPWREAVEIAIAVADGLAAAHGKGIIHRDIKPDNVFLTRDGHVKILDFGIARVPARSKTATESIATRPGSAIGTIGYMAPEQLRGEPPQPSTDVFSTGCLLHEMVTGRKVFGRESTADTIAAILSAEPPRMSDFVHDVPPELEGVVARSLRKLSSERQESAGQLSSELRQIRLAPEGYITAISARSPFARRPFLWIAVSAVMLILVALLLRSGNPFAGITEPLAILPILNQSGDSGLDYVSDGITESLINTMSQVPQLKVVARTSAFHYHGLNVDPQTAGRALAVQRVFTGKMSRQGDSINLQVQLLNVADGARLWEGRYLQKPTEMSSLPATVSTSIARTLRLQLTAAEHKRLSRVDTRNQDAYRLCLLGRYYFNQRDANDRDALHKSIESFQRAIDQDPLYVTAYIGLAEAYATLPRYTSTPSRESALKAKAAALKALEIDDAAAEADIVLASMSAGEWDWPEAEKAFRRALLLMPGNATGHSWYGECLAVIGRSKEAVAELRLASELDPLSPHIGMVLASVLYTDRQYDRAVEQSRKVLELNPNSAIAYIHIALSQAVRRRFAEAIVALDRANNIMPGISTGLRAYIDAQTGDRQAALNVLGQLTAAANAGRGTALDLPAAYVGLDEKGAAFEALNRACDRRMPLIDEIKVDPLFDPLRSDPRYPLLLRRMNLTP
jgi:serine/threonine protein kinase/Tfp pilus assembly protein PilF